MKINIKTTNISLTDAITEYTNKRLEKVDKLLSREPNSQCDVELAKTTGHHMKGEIFKAEIHIVGMGKNLYASSEKEDLYSAIDAVQVEIIREINSSRERRLSIVRKSGAKVKAMMKGMWPFNK